MFNFKSHLVVLGAAVLSSLVGCQDADTRSAISVPKPQVTLTQEQTHNKWSSAIAPVATVPSGAVVEVYTEEASDQQLSFSSTAADVPGVQFDPIHPLTGPVFVEGAEPGDVLAVKILTIEIGDWGWAGIFPGFGFLADQFTQPYLKTFELGKDKKEVRFNDKINIPLRPFAGVMGVAPATEEMLSTIPPRANGGNMDDPNLVAGTTVYFPIFVKGALFSIGDTHAAQGQGEVCGTAIEAPMRIVYQLDVIKGGREIQEPQYETDEYYAVTGFGATIDAAARKATGFMVDYLVAEHHLDRNEAYVLCSLAADLKIAEVVDVPHVLVAMHISKSVLGVTGE